ncbi:heme oxygenase-like protein [Zopfia rhizophila CBS 207.26]|uniref:Heme oxygenase-like protein n=1 Tax=Zopfia rhizophila CBS 207.26 TaxID=1314779 RepID=A0A6A6E7K6_9PEZI|nr:heme oxygenase-like protein [Zopfia rhizophila CBS 207.26]
MSDAIRPNSLPGEINAATRTLHTNLNRLVTSRLPLGLPPHTPDPTLYTTGLLHFAHIYLTFESLWADQLPALSNPPTSPLLSFLLVDPWDASESSSPPPSPRMLEFLQTIRPKGLARSGRLKRDLEMLTGFHGTDLSVLLSQFPGQKVQEYCTHIRKVVREKPHVLVAYAWCFYMAVFSGGRWIRSELFKGGEEFWRSGTLINGKGRSRDDETVVSLEEKGLSFWHFDGVADGEDIKAEFKRRLGAAEDLFTPQERADVIEEAKEVFKFSAGLVQELDEKLGTDMEKLRGAERARLKTEAGDTKQVALVVAPSFVTWYRRPEVTGAAIALGCLACVAILRFDPRGVF